MPQAKTRFTEWSPTFDFSESPTLGRFLTDDTRVRIVVGPVGSGKTLACCFEIFKRALEQEPGPDGYRYVKAAIVRNTVPELKTTTIETWLAAFPEKMVGRFIKTAPMHHLIERPLSGWIPGVPPEDQPEGAEPGLKLRVDFFGLDDEKDVNRLMSYEATIFFFNEVRFIPRRILETATDRVGRYPSIAKGGVFPTWEGIICDTNSYDKDHYLYSDEHVDPPENWKFYHQPMAILEAEEEQAEDGSKTWRATERGHEHVWTPHRSRVTHAAKRIWIANPDAENLRWVNKHDPKTGEWLVDPLGKTGYYLSRVAGKPLDWIQVMYQGKAINLREGRPVIIEFDRDMMVNREIEVVPGIPIVGGLEIGAGTLNPAAVFGQRLPNGLWLIHDEIAGLEIGLIRFAEEMKNRLGTLCRTARVGEIWGDPAGSVRDGVTEQTYFVHLQRNGIDAAPAPTNDLQTRIEALRAPMGRMIEKVAGIQIHPRCEMLIKGLESAWQYRRVTLKGIEKHMQTPDKSDFSHVCEALGYLLLGGGEGRRLAMGMQKAMDTVVAGSNFDVWD